MLQLNFYTIPIWINILMFPKFSRRLEKSIGYVLSSSGRVQCLARPTTSVPQTTTFSDALFPVTSVRRPAGRYRPDQVRQRHRWDPNVDEEEAVIIGTVRAVRRLSDASWPSCRNSFTVHIQGAIKQAEAGHAAADQVRMARDVAAMFDELRAMADKHAALHADQARLQAELERGRTELARARRPWWRRLVGSDEPTPDRSSEHFAMQYVCEHLRDGC
jgi:hypothetical protein